jgi:hypothetical protein
MMMTSWLVLECDTVIPSRGVDLSQRRTPLEIDGRVRVVGRHPGFAVRQIDAQIQFFAEVAH